MKLAEVLPALQRGDDVSLECSTLVECVEKLGEATEKDTLLMLTTCTLLLQECHHNKHYLSVWRQIFTPAFVQALVIV